MLVATHWIDRIDWADARSTPRDTRPVKASPKYQESAAIDREYETRLHDAHDRQGYWD